MAPTFRYADLQKLFWVTQGFQDWEVYGAVEGEALAGRGRDGDRIQTRMKMFRRVGFPGASQLSRGPASQYSLDDVFQLAFAMSLMESAMTAQAAALLVRKHWNGPLGQAPADAWAALGKREESLLAVIRRTSFDGFSKSSTLDAWDWLPEPPAFEGDWTEPVALDVMWSGEFARNELLSPKCEVPLPFGRHHGMIINISKVTHALVMLMSRLGLANEREITAWLQRRQQQAS